jgi:sodium/hydrogen exchanger-like protein 6/7
MSGSEETAIAAILIFLLLVIYIIGGSFMEKKQFIIGHETGVAIILGFLISLIALNVDDGSLVHLLEFNGSIFFYVCLPPIIFASGFNMRRKRFFENFGYIALFGVFGTVITFLVFSVMTYLFMSTGMMYKYQDGE